MKIKRKNSSPWIEQIDRSRPVKGLDYNTKTQVTVIGAGIAGVSTAYFLLTRTRKKVVIAEASKVAHGATGHNAGQIASYFERPFRDIVHEFGEEMASKGQMLIYSVWDLIQDIQSDLDLKTPCHIFTGYAGCVDFGELENHLESNLIKKRNSVEYGQIYISEEFIKNNKIPSKFSSLYTIISKEAIKDLLQTKDGHYIAVLTSKKGCMNSALFCEEIIEKLLLKYPKRLRVFEDTPIKTVELYKKFAVLIAGNKNKIRTKRVVLCTNGFEKFHIVNKLGSNIDTKFHHLIKGSVGYMAAFREVPQMSPTAISYLPKKYKSPEEAYDAEPYFYLTRRPNSLNIEAGLSSMVCIGGPEALMDDTNNYKKEHPYPEEAKRLIDSFVKKTYRHAGKRLIYTHFWHGLMGYTPNGIRCVGEEPCNPILLYNLGCNGVGIMSSIYGGLRVSQIINKEKLEPSIFDPQDQRCF